MIHKKGLPVKRKAYKRFLLMKIVAALLSFSAFAGACPNCFVASNRQTLYTYYLSAIFLSAMPFAIIGAILAWLYRHKRKNGRPEMEPDAEEK
jgi:membrane protein DedA with SNARE-associated domain